MSPVEEEQADTGAQGVHLWTPAQRGSGGGLTPTLQPLLEPGPKLTQWGAAAASPPAVPPRAHLAPTPSQARHHLPGRLPHIHPRAQVRLAARRGPSALKVWGSTQTPQRCIWPQKIPPRSHCAQANGLWGLFSGLEISAGPPETGTGLLLTTASNAGCLLARSPNPGTENPPEPPSQYRFWQLSGKAASLGDRQARAKLR